MTAAYQVGFDAQTAGHVSKGLRSNLLRKAGVEPSSESVADFQAGYADAEAKAAVALAELKAAREVAEAAPKVRVAGNGANTDGVTQKQICRCLEDAAGRAEMVDASPATEKQCWYLAGLILKDGVDGWGSELFSSSLVLTKRRASSWIESLAAAVA